VQSQLHGALQNFTGGGKIAMDYKTTASPARTQYVEKRSRFIASSAPVSSEEDAVDFINKVKTEFYDAKHNVFAYCLKCGAERFSDDGEPQGTAGIPALEVLRRREVVNTVVVVTRYFGGVLLGAPGLVRAYTHAVAATLDEAGVIVMRHCDILKFACGYDFYAHADGISRAFGGYISNRKFQENVTLEIFMPKDKTADFTNALTEASGGSVNAIADGETFLNLQ
jgi:uncharacterized YigZ family protein